MSESETIAALPPDLSVSAVLARKSVSPSYADLSRLIGRGRQVTLSLAGEDVILALHLVEGEKVDWGDAMTLSGPGGKLAVAQGARLLRALTGIDPGVETPANGERWAWMEAALVGRLARTPFGFADCILHQAEGGAESACTLRLTLKTSHHAIVFHARASVPLWRHVLSRAAWGQELLPAHVCLDMPYAADIGIARHDLPARALHAITPGDILLPSNPAFSCNGEGRVHLAGLHARVRYRAPCALEIIAIEGSTDIMDTENMTPDTYSGGIAAGNEDPRADAASLDAVPVTLDFSLGQVRMRLGDMRRLGAGAILPLTGGSPASIAIRSADRVIGRGEAVDINGQLGIRIVEWGAGE